MSKNIKLRKGLDINLKGKAEAVLEVAPMAKSKERGESNGYSG